MIPHPKVENLLKWHGNTREGRQAAREQLLNDAVEYAKRESRLMGLSHNCQTGVQWRSPHGCRNDGSSCLCACHDPASEGDSNAA